MNKSFISVILILLSILTVIILMSFIVLGYDNFLGCYHEIGDISKPLFTPFYHGIKTNKDRLGLTDNIDNKEKMMGPIKNFHQKFTQNEIIPELKWRQELEKSIYNLNNVENINIPINNINNPIDNVYNYVNY